MNKTRRTKLKTIHTRLSDTVEELRMLATEEEEYRDNLPDNLQGSEKFDKADTAAYNINDVADNVENTLDTLEESWT
jgi:flagellar biosynthesis chaperone FliJ